MSDIEKNIFRFLTPEELEEMVSTKKKYKSVPLTEVILTDLERTEREASAERDDPGEKGILEEKKKLKKINDKLKRREIVKLYRANSGFKLGNKKEERSEYPPSERSGLLVKKRI